MRRSAVAVALVVALGGGAVLGWWSNAMVAEVAPEPAEVPSVLTVTVREGVLDDAILVEAGFDFASAGSIRGSGVVTAAPDPNAVVDEGEAPFEYELAPQFVLLGDRPMFRDLVAGSRGQDVVQLHAALNRLGYDVEAEDELVTVRTFRAWQKFLADRGIETARLAAVIGSREIAFLPQVPARIGTILVDVGDTAAGVVAELQHVEPSVYVVVPSSIPVTQVESSDVFLISPVDQSLVETVVSSRQVQDDGALRIDLDADVPPEWLGLPLRGRIGGSSGTDAGLVVPVAALSTGPDGASVLRVLDVSGAQRVVDVAVLATTRTEAMIEGDVAAGEVVVIGQ